MADIKRDTPFVLVRCMTYNHEKYIKDSPQRKSHWRLNKIENGVCHFHIELNESADTIDFYPLDDVAGCARIVSVSVNDKPMDVSNFADFKYMPKVSGHYTLPFPQAADKTIIDIAWDYQSNNDFLQAHS